MPAQPSTQQAPVAQHATGTCQCSTERQTLLFSATMPAQLSGFISVGLRDPQLIRLDVENKVHSRSRARCIVACRAAC